MPKIIAAKQDWIILGYKLFAEHGIRGIVVEKMATILAVNKSSFYWHFKTKTDFVNVIIEQWVESDTNGIINSISSDLSGKEKLDKLVMISFKKEPYLDFIFFLKRYALQNKKIQTLIDRIDNRRIDYTKNVLEEMGFPEEDADAKSKLFYKYLIGYHEMIRYKKQPKDYTTHVKKELNQFIKY